MPAEYYFFIIALLLLTAVADLIVGVANDAVNFLNSAVGSRVATRNVIMTIASAGILIGAVFSNGMMEVARKGIMNPALFSFADVMIIFMAVMFTDILLLDLFNTFGLPTSTTVSIVFELLGASVAMAFFKVMSLGDPLSSVGDYINASSTITIISGIFLSVSIAFLVGTTVQWISRLLFSFQYEKRMQLIGGLWSGFALAGITYFLLFKGMKGASFLPEEWVRWTSEHAGALFFGSLLVWTVLMQLLITVFRLNVLRGVVLFGTFALAMAFAGNDLVNFIGVPMAGLDAFISWKASGMEAGTYMMESLTKAVRTNTWMLLSAGIIMILTLWFSKKARTVTETEVNLGRQDDGAERFPSNQLARSIVWYSRKSTSGLTKLLPVSWLTKAESNFMAPDSRNPDAPAFDLIRASVNLTAASSLIALATSMKLPLSTTYVTFMVAMGTSLADRAWGRGSAVYRVAGVLNVIGGWFMTAVIAFSVAALFATVIAVGGLWGIALLILTGAAMLIRTFIMHRKNEYRKIQKEGHPPMPSSETQVMQANIVKAATLLRHTGSVYEKSINGLLEEDAALMKSAVKMLDKTRVDKGTLQLRLYRSIKHLNTDVENASQLLLQVYEIEQDIVQSLVLIVDSSNKYVKDSLPPFSFEQQQYLGRMAGQVEAYTHLLANYLEKGNNVQEQVNKLRADMLQSIEDALAFQIRGLRHGHFGMRNSALWFSLLLETKDLIVSADRFRTTLDKINTSELESMSS